MSGQNVKDKIWTRSGCKDVCIRRFKTKLVYKGSFAGWHCSWCLSWEEMQIKLAAMAETKIVVNGIIRANKGAKPSAQQVVKGLSKKGLPSAEADIMRSRWEEGQEMSTGRKLRYKPDAPVPWLEQEPMFAGLAESHRARGAYHADSRRRWLQTCTVQKPAHQVSVELRVVFIA